MSTTPLSVSQPSATKPSAPTPDEIAKASLYLVKSRDGLIASLIGLSTSQLEFKSAPDHWSITEIVEHLVLIEGAVHNIMARMPEASLAPPEWSQSAVDATILRDVPQRTTKISAPPHVAPSGRWTPAEVVVEFLDRRDRTLQLLSASCLRGRVIPHPLLGLWDGYHWIIAAACHVVRHTEQIREVKSAPGFPSVVTFSSAAAVN